MAPDPKDIELDDDDCRLLADAAKQADSEPHQSNDATAHQESLYEKRRRLGAVGLISGSPRDVSTNKKYMKGFGQDQ